MLDLIAAFLAAIVSSFELRGTWLAVLGAAAAGRCAQKEPFAPRIDQAGSPFLDLCVAKSR